MLTDMREKLVEAITNKGYEVIDAPFSQNVGHLKVRVHLERHSNDSRYRIRNYYIITLYLDKKLLSDSERDKLMQCFTTDIRQLFTYEVNNLGIDESFHFAGDSLININNRLEGYKILYGLNSKI